MLRQNYLKFFREPKKDGGEPSFFGLLKKRRSLVITKLGTIYEKKLVGISNALFHLIFSIMYIFDLSV